MTNDKPATTEVATAVIEQLERDLALADQGGCVIVLSTNQARQIVEVIRHRARVSDGREALGKVVHSNGPVVIDFMGEDLAWRPLDHGTWTPFPTQEAVERLMAATYHPQNSRFKGHMRSDDDSVLVSVRDLRDVLARHRAMVSDGELQAKIWQRGDEWILEISGEINDTSFVSRHTEPLTTPKEGVAGLPSLYASLATRSPDDKTVEPDGDDLSGHIFRWFNDQDPREMQACLEAYDARAALGDTA